MYRLKRRVQMYSFFGALIQDNCKTYLNTIIINGTPYLGLPCDKYRIRAIGVIRGLKILPLRHQL